MRLRTQLALFFLLTTGSVLAVGFVTLWAAGMIVDRFSFSLTQIENLSQIRGLQNLLSRERSSLEIARRSNSPDEVHRLRSLHKVVSMRFNEVSSMGGEVPRELAAEHDELAAFLEGSPGGLAAASRLIDEVAVQVNDAEFSLSERARKEQQLLHSAVRRGGWILFGFLFWEMLLGYFFAMGTFRSMHRALRQLQAGTEAFGKGRFDHRIPAPPAGELGDLARSFNQMAENIKSLEASTVHMHRMSAVGQLAGGVAHEINNPLTGVLGQAQILMEKLPPEDPRRSHAEKIERAAIRCRRIVRSLLDFSRKKEAHFAAFDLHDTLSETLDLCEPDVQSARVRVLKDFSPLIPPMTGNTAQLQQVFLNMVSNALHAMPKGGALTITTVLAAFPVPGGTGKTDGVEISFQDTGSGIAAEHIDHVFEPFFTTKEIGKGTGLGLSVSLGIVRNHGGDIRVESDGGEKGTVFRVFLPLTPPSHMSAAALPPEGGGTRFGT
jgi:signal transduction histidine kinase